jgi:acetyl-CoA/propionyl-CoA carboxylase, biotin carboxylase, biotin carboxyl carrier protein
VEESPAPAFPHEIRAAMGSAAVDVAKACGYVNAGTVEFLYQDGEFYFLEMNTRLQVEHPVTEMVTGIDLVHEQLRVAAGEALSFTQGDIERRGHAIEVRINAEDPAGGRFLPSPGRIAGLSVPQGFGVRWDGGYEAGDDVSQFYDNLIGKLIVWGSDRPTAIRRMQRALGELRVDGVATTASAHRAILAHPEFQAAEHSTKWVEERLDLTSVSGAGDSGQPPATDDRPATTSSDIDVEVDGRRFSVRVWMPEGAGLASQPAAQGASPTAARPRRPAASRSGGGGTAGAGSITVPMQGTIVKVLVAEGDTVAVGQPVCVLEAMKMENNINAESSGTVTAVRVEPGQSVGAGDVVVVIG